MIYDLRLNKTLNLCDRNLKSKIINQEINLKLKDG